MITTTQLQISAINQRSQSGSCETVFWETEFPTVRCVIHFAKQEMNRCRQQDSGKLSVMNKLGLWEKVDRPRYGELSEVAGWDLFPQETPHPRRLNVICLGSNMCSCKSKPDILQISPSLTGNLIGVTEWTNVIIKSSLLRFYCACNPNRSRRGRRGMWRCHQVTTA